MDHVVRQLRKGQRDHDEVHATRAQRQCAHEQRVSAAEQHAQRGEQQGGSRFVGGGAQHGGVSPDAKERSLAKTHQPGRAHEQFQAQCQDGEDHDLGDQAQRIAAGHEGHQQQQQEARQQKEE